MYLRSKFFYNKKPNNGCSQERIKSLKLSLKKFTFIKAKRRKCYQKQISFNKTSIKIEQLNWIYKLSLMFFKFSIKLRFIISVSQAIAQLGIPVHISTVYLSEIEVSHPCLGSLPQNISE